MKKVIVLVLVMLIFSLTACDESSFNDQGKNKIERFEEDQNNDYSVMYSREKRNFIIKAYPAGITVEDFSIESINEYDSYISGLKTTDKNDYTEISFNLCTDSSLVKQSSDRATSIVLKSKNSNAELQTDHIALRPVEIYDAEPLNMKVNKPQIATFKVVPASYSLNDLQIGKNAYVDIQTDITDSEIDEENNCQYVHVEITVRPSDNPLSAGYVNLNDKIQARGGTCNFSIEQ